LYETPTWLLDKNILNKITSPTNNERIQTIQTGSLTSLLDGQRLFRLAAASNRFGGSTYSIDEMMDDVRKGVWSELSTRKPIDPYRRNLQKAYAEKLIEIIAPATPTQAITILQGGRGGGFTPPPAIKNTDVTSVVRGQLRTLQAEINSAIPGTTDKMSRYHLQDVSDRIKKALDPK
jgi:hypothetical protein